MRVFDDTPGLLTTGDVARGLMLSREGVRYLVRDGQLPCFRMKGGGWRTFRPVDVDRLGRRRQHLREAGALPRRRTLGPRGQPRQLAFNSLFRAPLRLVPPSGATLDKSQVRRAALLQKGAGSDNRPTVDLKVARALKAVS